MRHDVDVGLSPDCFTPVGDLGFPNIAQVCLLGAIIIRSSCLTISRSDQQQTVEISFWPSQFGAQPFPLGLLWWKASPGGSQVTAGLQPPVDPL